MGQKHFSRTVWDATTLSWMLRELNGLDTARCSQISLEVREQAPTLLHLVSGDSLWIPFRRVLEAVKLWAILLLAQRVLLSHRHVKAQQFESRSCRTAANTSPFVSPMPDKLSSSPYLLGVTGHPTWATIPNCSSQHNSCLLFQREETKSHFLELALFHSQIISGSRTELHNVWVSHSSSA